MSYKIFNDKHIKAHDKGMKAFFLFGIEFLKKRKQIYDDVDNHPILKGIKRKRLISLMNESFTLMQQNK